MKIHHKIGSRLVFVTLVVVFLVLTAACQQARQAEAENRAEPDSTAAAHEDGAPPATSGAREDGAQPAPNADDRNANRYGTDPAPPSPTRRARTSRPSPSVPRDEMTREPANGRTVEAPPPEPAVMMVSIIEGRNIQVTLNEALSSKTSQIGDPFTATVVKDVQAGEAMDVAIPAGSVIHGQVVEVQPAKQLKGQAKLGLRFDELRLVSGKRIDIVASLRTEGKNTTKRSVGAIAGGAAAGAILGKVLGKEDKDAAIGAVAGAAIGTGVVLGMDNKDVKLTSGTELTLKVDQDFEVPVTSVSRKSSSAGHSG